jgi:hypothetical protein
MKFSNIFKSKLDSFKNMINNANNYDLLSYIILLILVIAYYFNYYDYKKFNKVKKDIYKMNNKVLKMKRRLQGLDLDKVLSQKNTTKDTNDKMVTNIKNKMQKEIDNISNNISKLTENVNKKNNELNNNLKLNNNKISNIDTLMTSDTKNIKSIKNLINKDIKKTNRLESLVKLQNINVANSIKKIHQAKTDVIDNLINKVEDTIDQNIDRNGRFKYTGSFISSGKKERDILENNNIVNAFERLSENLICKITKDKIEIPWKKYIYEWDGEKYTDINNKKYYLKYTYKIDDAYRFQDQNNGIIYFKYLKETSQPKIDKSNVSQKKKESNIKEVSTQVQLQTMKKNIISINTNNNNNNKKKLLTFISKLHAKHKQKMNNPNGIWKVCHDKCSACDINKDEKCYKCLKNCNIIHECFKNNVKELMSKLKNDLHKKVYSKNNNYDNDSFYNILNDTKNNYFKENTLNNKCYGYYYNELMIEARPFNFTDEEKKKISSNLDHYCSLVSLAKCGMKQTDSIKWLNKNKNKNKNKN